MGQDRYKVLLLEDNPLDAELVVNAVSGLSVSTEIVVCRTADEYRAKLPEFSPDVVLSDYNLPNYSGKEALLYLQQLDRDDLVPFILVTGVIALRDAASMMKDGLFDLIEKDHLVALEPALLRAFHVAEERRVAQKQEGIF